MCKHILLPVLQHSTVSGGQNYAAFLYFGSYAVCAWNAAFLGFPYKCAEASTKTFARSERLAVGMSDGEGTVLNRHTLSTEYGSGAGRWVVLRALLL